MEYKVCKIQEGSFIRYNFSNNDYLDLGDYLDLNVKYGSSW